MTEATVSTTASSSLFTSDKGVVFEYQGCYTHGCVRCFENKRDTLTAFNRTHNEAYENTRCKIDKIKSHGYEVSEIWECEFDRRITENPQIANYVNNHLLISKMILNPRDAFFGGRTENIRFIFLLQC